jgi:hypothetical protein
MERVLRWSAAADPLRHPRVLRDRARPGPAGRGDARRARGGPAAPDVPSGGVAHRTAARRRASRRPARPSPRGCAEGPGPAPAWRPPPRPRRQRRGVRRPLPLRARPAAGARNAAGSRPLTQVSQGPRPGSRAPAGWPARYRPPPGPGRRRPRPGYFGRRCVAGTRAGSRDRAGGTRGLRRGAPRLRSARGRRKARLARSRRRWPRATAARAPAARAAAAREPLALGG